jgi:hypothetical protein
VSTLRSQSSIASGFYNKLDKNGVVTWFIIDSDTELGLTVVPPFSSLLYGILHTVPRAKGGFTKSGYILVNAAQVPHYRFKTNDPTNGGFVNNFSLERALGHELAHAALLVGEDGAVDQENKIAVELYGASAPVRIGHDIKHE